MMLRLAMKSLAHHKGFTALFVMNLALGLVGFLSLTAIKASVQEELQAKQRALLGADLTVSARRELSDDEQQVLAGIIPKKTKEQKTISLYSMLSAGNASRLVNIIGVEDRFPFYGELQLKNKGNVVSETSKIITKEKRLWVGPEVLVQLGVELGDSVLLAGEEFILDDVVLKTAGSAAGFSLAPTIYIGSSFLEASPLYGKKSLVTHTRQYAFPLGKHNLKELQDKLNQGLSDPGIRINTPQTANQQTQRLSRYMGDFLGMVVLVGLLLAIIGSVYLFQGFTRLKQQEVATMRCIGFGQKHITRFYLWILIGLGVVASLLSIFLCVVFLPFLSQFLHGMLPVQVHAQVGLEAALVSFFLGTGGTFLSCFPTVIINQRQRVAETLQFQSVSTQKRRKGLLLYLPAALIFFLLSLWQTRSFLLSGLFFVGIVIATLLLVAIALFLAWALKRQASLWGFSFKMAFLNLARSPFATLSCLVALGLGALLLTIIPQVQQSLESELKTPSVQTVPSLFLFDIQEDQLQPIENLLQNKGSKLAIITPLIRGRILKINGEDFKKENRNQGFQTREGEVAQRFRNRGINLTYRPDLIESETLVSGQKFSGRFDPSVSEVAEISVEYQYAERLGIKIGDQLLFSIHGLEIPGKVINLRKVAWTSFQPNFFIVFQDGVLNEAPKVHLAVVPQNKVINLSELQASLVQSFPNVSMIDVRQVIGRVLDLFHDIGIVMRVMAVLALCSGFFVLFAIARHQAYIRRKEIRLLKMVGASFVQVRQMVMAEFAFLASLAGILGAGMSVGVSWVVLKQVFQRGYELEPVSLIVVPLALVSVSLIVSRLATNKDLKARVKTLD